MGRVVALANQKGGVGKTTMAVSLGACAAEAGLRVALVDLDPQATLTRWLAAPVEEGQPTSYDLVVRREATVTEVLRPTACGLLVAPATVDLAVAPADLQRALRGVGLWQTALRPKLQAPNDLDLLLVDCPPSLGELTMLALVAADDVAIVTNCELTAFDAMQDLIACIDLARSPGLNPDLRSLGILPTMYDSRSLHCRQVLQLLRTHYPDAVPETVIRRTIKLADAYARNVPITQYDRNGEVTDAFRRLAREVLYVAQPA
ncbi:MAG TPA: ParA family protein [Chloroflexota bacterium]|nr:ParA family protein [Chloroflexota bacterium]